ncbi:MAG: tetratricopeptide repeat protein [Chloroflexi bacterium]|nr:tetratricopeptide repeat protein [Chloroflexota bacterium]
MSSTRASRHMLIGLATGALLLITAACGGGKPAAQPPASPAASASIVDEARAEQQAHIDFLLERSAGDPLDVFSLNGLALEYMQRARETGDVSDLARAEESLTRSLEIRPTGNYDGVVLLASVNATMHDFAQALDLAQSAIALRPNEAYGYGVLGDAYMGLGRYDEADVAYEKMINLEPDLPAFGRRALWFQLRGMTDEAERSWQSAISRAESDGVPEHAAWANAQLANLYFMLGRIDDAGERYQVSLDTFPGYVHAIAGLGRVSAARGDLAAASDYYEQAIAKIPVPEYVVALGDLYAAQGDSAKAGDQYALVGAIEQLYTANGVNLDLQIGLFNADHDREIAATVERARVAFAEQPSLQAADVLAWAQYKAGDFDAAAKAIEHALATGTRETSVLYHAGMIFRATGDLDRAAEYLGAVQDQNPAFSVHEAPTARAAFEDVTAAVAGR